MRPPDPDFIRPRKTAEEVQEIQELRRRASIQVKSLQQTRGDDNRKAIRDSQEDK